jgi:hypothetical protein
MGKRLTIAMKAVFESIDFERHELNDHKYWSKFLYRDSNSRHWLEMNTKAVLFFMKENYKQITLVFNYASPLYATVRAAKVEQMVREKLSPIAYKVVTKESKGVYCLQFIKIK